jgi:hypothetical protein
MDAAVIDITGPRDRDHSGLFDKKDQEDQEDQEDSARMGPSAHLELFWSRD